MAASLPRLSFECENDLLEAPWDEVKYSQRRRFKWHVDDCLKFITQVRSEKSNSSTLFLSSEIQFDFDVITSVVHPFGELVKSPVEYNPVMNCFVSLGKNPCDLPKRIIRYLYHRISNTDSINALNGPLWVRKVTFRRKNILSTGARWKPRILITDYFCLILRTPIESNSQNMSEDCGHAAWDSDTIYSSAWALIQLL